MDEKRIVVPVSLRPQAKKQLDQICEARGMKQIEVATRLLDWFIVQDEVIQVAILGQLPASVRQDVARMVLEKLAGESKRKAS